MLMLYSDKYYYLNKIAKLFFQQIFRVCISRLRGSGEQQGSNSSLLTPGRHFNNLSLSVVDARRPGTIQGRTHPGGNVDSEAYDYHHHFF